MNWRERKKRDNIVCSNWKNMTDIVDEITYFNGKVPDKTYVSKRLESKDRELINGEIVEKIIPIRIASKVIDSDYSYEFIKELDETKLRVTSWWRQEITAKFLEEDKGVFLLQIQKFTVKNGMPHKTYFSFRSDEIRKLFNFIKNIKDLHIEDEKWFKITDTELKKLILTKEQAFSIYRENQDIFEEILAENITTEDVINLVYKKSQLTYFERLLNEEWFFEDEKIRLNIWKDEQLWQDFFESNTWIFGFSLQYIINTPLQDRKLEQVVEWFDVSTRGKRVDALMKSKWIISSLCFTEIKTHKTQLLNSAYRPSVFPPSNELSWGIAQIQKTIQSSLENLVNVLHPTDSEWNPTWEELYLYRPKSFLLIGSLSQFMTESGVNKEKYSSFEIYRRSIKDIEIITFDELLERANFIVNSMEREIPR